MQPVSHTHDAPHAASFMIAHTTSAKLQEIIKGLRGVYILESLSDSQLNKVAEAVQVCAPQQ